MCYSGHRSNWNITEMAAVEIKLKKIEIKTTEKCNRKSGSCGAKCFSMHDDEGWEIADDATTEQIIGMYDNILKAGITVVNLNGGEFFLRKDAEELLRVGHEMGLKMAVATNCDLLTAERLEKIAPYLTYLSISLDGGLKINDQLRGEGHFESAKRVIEAYDPKKHSFQLKVNTVLSAYNINDPTLDDIPGLLAGKNAIWKFIQFTPRGAGKNVIDRYAIEAKVFEQKVVEMKQKYPEIYICGRAFDVNDRPDTLIIRPNGEIRFNWLFDNPLVGNIFVDNLTDIICQVETTFSGFLATNAHEFGVCYKRGRQQ